MASGPPDVEEASWAGMASGFWAGMASGSEEVPQLPAWKRDLVGWMGRSEVHVRTWKRFTRERRCSVDDPVIVDQDLIESFTVAREFLLQAEFDLEIKHTFVHVGHEGQRWRIRHSCEFTEVIVRRTPDLDSAIIGRIMPGWHCIQRGALVPLDGPWTGVVRMPIHPEGWITYSSEAAAGGTMFVDVVDDPSEDSKERWSCSVCTFENEGRDSKCDTCGVPRPHA